MAPSEDSSMQICFIMLHLETLSDGSMTAPLHSDSLHHAGGRTVPKRAGGDTTAIPHRYHSAESGWAEGAFSFRFAFIILHHQRVPFDSDLHS